jgi:hypothetical protein
MDFTTTDRCDSSETRSDNADAIPFFSSDNDPKTNPAYETRCD